MSKGKEPKRNVYVGHRYVPLIMDEWDKQISYEGLSIVTYKGNSYTSKKRVPVGIDILNEEYWVVTGNYNAQIEQYRKDVREMQNHVDKEIDSIHDYLGQRARTIIPQVFGAVGDGVADDYPALVETFNYAMENGYTVDLLGGKTYLLKTRPTGTGDNANIFNITNTLNIVGKSTIKIDNNYGDYEAVFRLRVGASGSKFEDFTIDENTTNNRPTEYTAPNLDNHKGKRRITFYGYIAGGVGNGLTFKDLTLKDCIGVWQVQARFNNVTMDNINVIYADSLPQVPAYDRTCIYMLGENWKFINSFLRGSTLTKTAIETHGKNQTVDNVHVNDFGNIYLVNDNQSFNNDIGSLTFTNNHFDIRGGIWLWFTFDNIPVDSVSIDNNYIKSDTRTGLFRTQHMGGQNVRVKSVTFSNNECILTNIESAFVSLKNTITTEEQTNPIHYDDVNITDNRFNGVCSRFIELEVEPTRNQRIEKVNVSGNSFNAFIQGDTYIYFKNYGHAYKQNLFTNNKFNASGNTRYIARTPLTIAMEKMESLIFKDNQYINSFEKFSNEGGGLYYIGIYEKLDDVNKVDTSSNFNLNVLKGNVTDIKDRNYIIEDSQAVYKKIFSDTIPTSKRFNKGDIAYSNDPVASGCIGWVCITTGTPGTWRKFGEITV